MHISTLTLSALASVSVPPTASIQRGSEHIVGGNLSTGYPFMVALQKDGKLFCGGTLITPSTVVTAAHCIKKHPASEISVRLGVNRWDQTGGEIINATQAIPHPKFQSWDLTNDIGVIKLATPSKATPANLDITNIGNKVGIDATSVGWGRLYFGGPLPKELMEVNLKITNNAHCVKTFGDFDGEASICMLGTNSTGSPCNGDSGGPLIVNNTLIGVVSYGAACKEESVFSRVHTYIEWIKKITS